MYDAPQTTAAGHGRDVDSASGPAPAPGSLMGAGAGAGAGPGIGAGYAGYDQGNSGGAVAGPSGTSGAHIQHPPPPPPPHFQQPHPHSAPTSTHPGLGMQNNAVAGPSHSHSYPPLRSASGPHRSALGHPAGEHNHNHIDAAAAAAGASRVHVNPLDPSTYFGNSYATGITRIPAPINTEPFTSQHPDHAEGGTGEDSGDAPVSAGGSGGTSPLPPHPLYPHTQHQQPHRGYPQPHAGASSSGYAQTGQGAGAGAGARAGSGPGQEGYGGYMTPTLQAQYASHAGHPAGPGPGPGHSGPSGSSNHSGSTNGQPFPSVFHEPTYPSSHPHPHLVPGQGPAHLQQLNAGPPPYPYNPHYVPGEIPHESLMAAPQFLHPPPGHMVHHMNVPHSVQLHGYPLEEWADWDEEGEVGEWPADVSGQHVEVRHRRKTSPEQLKVLEHWFNINPKPDNQLREWLAGELGMTKRNIQVWFQNRRAKIKSNAFKSRLGLGLKKPDTVSDLPPDALRTPERQISTNPLDVSPAGREGTNTSSPGDIDIDDALTLPPTSAPPSEVNGFHPSASTSSLAPHPYPSLIVSPLAQGALPMSGPAMNGGRRVSLANGEADRIQVWAAKRTAQSGMAGGQRSPMGVGALMGSQLQLGQAAAARRGSIPYPYPAGNGYLSQISPRISPSVRHTPSALHLAAIRNNTTRRSSMPSGPQLISSGAFTPPRVVDGAVQPRAQRERELDPIRDDHESVFGNPALGGAGVEAGYTFGAPGTDGMGLPTTYLTPPQTSFQPSDPSSSSTANGSLLFTGGTASTTDDYTGGMLYTPAGPLPNPSFTFGTSLAAPDTSSAPHITQAQAHMQPQSAPAEVSGFTFGAAGGDDQRTREMELFFQFRDKGRLDSMASASGYASDGTTGTANGSMGMPEPWDWAVVPAQGQGQGRGQGQGQMNAGLGLPLGFNPDRRASAPEGLQHDLGMLGLELHGNAQLGPSPLSQTGPQGSNSGGETAQFIPAIALHSSDQHHQRPVPHAITTDLLLPTGNASVPSSAVGLGGNGNDPFTLSPVDMHSASPHAASLYSGHSGHSGHSHSAGPSPDASNTLQLAQGQTQAQGQGMIKPLQAQSQSMPVPGHFQQLPAQQPQPQQHRQLSEVPQHFGDMQQQQQQQAYNPNEGTQQGQMGATEEDMSWLDLPVDPAL